MKKKIYLSYLMIILLALGISTEAIAQRTISGKVTSESNEEQLIGVNVTVKGSATGTVTGLDGTYQIQANEGDVLVYSYIGMLNQEATVGAGTTMDIALVEDATTLSDVIVSATRQPIRKLETTTAVSVINSKVLSSIKPEGFSEAIQGTPGMYTSQSQGRFRGAIFTRGFPDGSGNGLVYTGILLDGLPTLATTARPPDFAFGMDLNVERIEVVRGSAATLFGRASAAGVVNIISKVGGEKTSGTVRVTNYNENVDSRSGFDYKLEANINGPISDKLRYNVGGYYVNDRGFRDLGYNDRGGQLRANLDYFLGNKGDKGSIRLYGSYVDVSIQNMIDIPYNYSDNTPREGWTIYDSYYETSLDTLVYSAVDKEGNAVMRTIQASNEDGNYARGFNVGLHFDINLTDRLTLSNKTRYQNYDHGTKFNLGGATFYKDGPFQQTRILVDGDGNDSDFMEELRLTYTIGEATQHNLSLGTYLSTGWYTPQTWSMVGWTLADPTNKGFNSFFGPAGLQSRLDDYTIQTTSFFFGDEISTIGNKLKVNLGIRYDKVNMDLEGFYGKDDPATVNVVREEQHDDYSFSLGGNYLLNARSSIYANFVSAFRMPDYSAYTAAKPGSLTPGSRDYKADIEDNERINNIEVGYRTGVGDLGIDIAGFYTKINNRLAIIYEGAIAVTKPLGTNVINGAELGLTYAPSSVNGLLVRGSFTLQNATFDEFKIPVTNADPTGNFYGNTLIDEGFNVRDSVQSYSIDLKGNQIPRVPSTILNLSAIYEHKYFGVNAALNYFANRFADATNLFKQDNITNLNLGVNGKYPLSDGSVIKVGLLAKNVLNTEKALRALYLSDNDEVIAQRQAIDADPTVATGLYYTGIPFLPRRILITLSYEF